jgi:hypothetical protein
MPFVMGLDDPHSTIIKESLFLGSNESRNLLQTIQAIKEMEAVDDLGIACCHHANEQYRFH